MYCYLWCGSHGDVDYFFDRLAYGFFFFFFNLSPVTALQPANEARH